ncbi:hypothetical protein [Shewanella fidelis]|uniref:Uncharacterized protein n=1 Tax=Shewanella fidelis TaxID=173509 RepID=A0AAW8NTE0_9GAMM|nr:hypothetical protein [Shewanella fidelis]MDR8525476.1 hypothetical protein [Shewanella fidelis]MDW4813205.1 hypothetical protein [Shewanella fidelis]MDW4816915.1 hypothetical protein [Shewanella fidelis]MDW4820074.1 hypothetical protein [Shewanella fidelis]MDW4825670.1 hypothetical protein [Shewanella fidelis]
MGVIDSLKLQYKIAKVASWIEDYISTSLEIHPRVFAQVSSETVSNYIASSARDYIAEAYHDDVEIEPFIHVCMGSAMCSLSGERNDVQHIVIYIIKQASTRCTLLLPLIELIPQSKSTSMI